MKGLKARGLESFSGSKLWLSCFLALLRKFRLELALYTSVAVLPNRVVLRIKSGGTGEPLT